MKCSEESQKHKVGVLKILRFALDDNMDANIAQYPKKLTLNANFFVKRTKIIVLCIARY